MSISDRRRYALDARHRSCASRIKTTFFASVVSMVCLGTATADDTEVFFGQVDRNSNNQPNVLFVLDTSGSMNIRDTAVAGNDTRLERMKDAMTTILNQSDNVNVGIMRFNGSSGGGAVLYPITSINEQICESNDCGEVNVIAKIAGSTDDIEEMGTGAVSLDGNILSLQAAGVGDENRKIGLRFKDLNIPQGATITSATLGFIARDDNNSSADTITIQTESTDNAATYAASASSASSRPYGTPAVWQPEPWQKNKLYNSVDIASQVQEVVNRAQWCGGNAMGFMLSGSATRDIVSYDASPANSPVLKISYDSTSIPAGGGCAVKYAIAQVSTGYDDAEEQERRFVNPWSQDLELFTDNGSKQTIGVRFTDVQIPKDSEILESNITFKAIKNSSGTTSGTITGESSASPKTYQRQRYNISRRPRTNSIVEWDNLSSIATNDLVVTPDISNIVAELTSRSTWQSGNALSFIMDSKTTAGKVSVASYNYSPTDAPKLVIKYKSIVQPSTEAPTYITARDRLLTEITGMTATGGTPVVDAYYEATQYMLGGAVDYGTQRGVSKSRFHRVSHPLAYTGGTLYRPDGCTDSDPDSIDCIKESISGSASYISPIESTCQTNHIVLLSDGEATSNSAVGKVESLIGESCAPNSDSRQKCGVDLAEWLQTTDHSDSLQGEQTIKTYTIGFNIDHPFLKSIAQEGGGRYFRADSAAELVARFQDILSDVYSVDTSFVAPGATVNQFNRLTHRDDIYFALFKPEERPTWSGNLKKYQVGLTNDGTVTVFDHSTPKKNAVDEEAGFFDETAKSDWSTVTDGSDVAIGGAAEMLSTLDASSKGLFGRQLYTILSNTDSIPSDGLEIIAEANLIHEDNTNFQDSDLGISSTEANVDDVEIKLDNLLKWARGIDVKDENKNGDTNDWRAHIGDPMHSRPVIMNYAASPEPYTTIFLGTNEGIVHAVNNVDGKELYSFMPKSLLPNIKSTFVNSTGTKHPYGLDGPITTWTVDANNNVMVDSNEKAMMFMGMRRGGSNYYAFDIAQRKNPKLKWVIKGGDTPTPGFEQLGQSWSRMVPTKIRYKNDTRNVVIFGGGYDLSNDVDYTVGAVPKSEDTIGRAIFIVDAETGELINQIGHSSDTGADVKFNDLKYAIPSDVRVLDIDGNGFADSLFVGDMGGQVWRFDFNLYHDTGDLLQGGVLAQLGSTSTTSLVNNRRFFYEPDVALMRENGERYLSVAIGSGWRSHPLNTDVKDEFYVIRSYDVYNLPEGYGKKVADGDYKPLTRDDLTDISSDVDTIVSSHGWRLTFNDSGEKVLGDALTVNGQIVFTTYMPESNLVACASALGSGAVYAMRVADGRPSLDLDNDGSKTTVDRRDVLNHAGVPPEATALIVEGNVLDTDGNLTKIIKPTILVGPEQPLDGLFDTNLTRREFWIDAGMTHEGARGASIDARQDSSTTTAETQTQ